MKSLHCLPALALAALLTGCASHKGTFDPQDTTVGNQAMTSKFVLMDPGAQRSVSTAGLREQRLDDGRLRVECAIKNRENRRIQVQVNCVFKDDQGFATGDETPFQTLILAENSTEAVRFTAMNTAGKKYTIRVRQAR